MTFNSLRLTVHKSLIQQTFSKYDDETNNVNSILTGCLVLSTVQKLISANSKNEVKTQEFVNQYISTFKNIAESLKNKFISYKLIHNKIVKSKIKSFLNVDQQFVNEVVKLYENKETVKTFSPIFFSQNMYNVTNLSDYNLNNLEFTHKNIVTPIILHYNKVLNILYSQVYLEIDYDSFSGKNVYITIDGVDNARILSDLDKDIFNIKKYLYSYGISSKKSVKLIIK